MWPATPDQTSRPGEESIVSYAVFNPEQVKSADPLTYNDQGELIPLSERFNLKATDIRFMAELKDEAKEDSLELTPKTIIDERGMFSIVIGAKPGEHASIATERSPS